MMKERDLFAALPTIDEAVSRRLHRRLVDAANAAGLLDVAYRTIDTPVGALLLAATPKGLVRVAYASEDHDLVLEGLARDVSPRILRAPARLDGVAREIEEYFAGRRARQARLPGRASGRRARRVRHESRVFRRRANRRRGRVPAVRCVPARRARAMEGPPRHRASASASGYRLQLCGE